MGVRVLRTIGVKLVTLIPVLFLVSLGTFFLVDLIPGHPEVEVLGANAAPDDYIRVREQLGSTAPCSSATASGSATSSPATSARACCRPSRASGASWRGRCR